MTALTRLPVYDHATRAAPIPENLSALNREADVAVQRYTRSEQPATRRGVCTLVFRSLPDISCFVSHPQDWRR